MFDGCTGLATAMSQLPLELHVSKMAVASDAPTVGQMQDGTTIPVTEIAWHFTTLAAEEMEIISMNTKIAVLSVQKVGISTVYFWHVTVTAFIGLGRRFKEQKHVKILLFWKMIVALKFSVQPS